MRINTLLNALAKALFVTIWARVPGGSYYITPPESLRGRGNTPSTRPLNTRLAIVQFSHFSTIN